MSNGQDTINFSGDVSRDRAKISGEWRSTGLTGKFFLQVSSQVDFDMKINYNNQNSSWINLNGQFDLENATFKGHSFQVSLDL